MTSRYDEILQAALTLPENERLQLADEIAASVEESIDPGYEAEIIRRVERCRSGEDPGIPSEEVHARVHALIEQQRALKAKLG
jgi:putative addiction module component (TIGR02574 family)